jgi:hypothetical protein
MDVVHSEYGILYSLTTPEGRPPHHRQRDSKHRRERQTVFFAVFIAEEFLQNHRGFLFAER